MNRREFFLKSAQTVAGASLLRRSWALAAPSALLAPPPLADYTLRIAPFQLELAPGKIVHTTAFNGRVPGELIRIGQGRPVVIDVINDTGTPDLVHWHGMHIPSVQDGALPEGSLAVAPHGGTLRYSWVAEPAGFRWYHSHQFAGHNLSRATYSGEFGFLMIDPPSDPARYDQEIFLALHDWQGQAQGGGEGYEEVVYRYSSINDRMLGFGDPIRVQPGQRVLLHVVNASATLMHDLALPGHRFLVTALDGNPVPQPGLVETIRLGPAERVDAVVEMNHPGVWVLGETDAGLRRAGMGIVVEYAGRSGAPAWRDPSAFDFQYELFAAPSPPAADPGEVVLPLAIKPKFEGYGDFDHWTINGLSWPNTNLIHLTEGTRYRLVIENQSIDVHPVHLHRHSFELRRLNGRPTAGVVKDVVLLEPGVKTEVSFTANNPGKTLFHCHQQDHMDSGFMMLFDYV